MKAASEGPDSWPHLDAGPLENGDSAHLTEVERRQRELQSKQQQLLREQRSADQERLLACITGELPRHLFPVRATWKAQPWDLCTGASNSELCLVSGIATS